ncbi:MAG: hypothetical protein MUF54_04655 [Polyangiaceae bacterium]|jgi:hypothetical protein|nr:hypothetical protein [Polyangiaceae bacterium]
MPVHIVMSTRASLAAMALLLGCAGPGPYGYARTYEPTEDEERASEPARELDLVTARRLRKQWASQPVSLFGVVSERLDERAGWTPLLISVRRLQQRNLCEDASARSCRVTVSEREIGKVIVLVKLRGADDQGEGAVAPGALLRVVGQLRPSDGTEEEPLQVRATFYRQWPSTQYVTTALRKYMRR